MSSSTEAIQTALAHHQAGRLAEAERIYRRVLKNDPRHAPAMHLLGLVAFQSGKPQMAVQYISQAIRLDGGQAAFHANLGEAYRGLGRLEDARACYLQALRLKPDLPEAQNNLGTILQALGRTDEAIACYQSAVAARPAYADAHNNLGTAYQDLRNWDAAVACYRRSVEVSPAYAKGHYNLGIALRALGDDVGACAALERATVLEPNHAEAFRALAMVLQKQGRLDEADAAFRRTLEIKPQSADALIGLGTILQARGKADPAIGYYVRALGIRPDYAEAHYNWGTALVDQGRSAEAEAKYRQAIACKPDFADAQYNLGTVLQEQGRLEEAADAYREAVRLRPGLTSAHNNLGNLYSALGEPAEAVACYQRALDARPEDGDALNNLGNVLHEQGQVADTVEYFERALRAKPDFAEAYNNLGNVLQQMGESERALACYQKCLQLLPEFPEAHLNLAMLYLSQERFAEGWPEYFWRLKCKKVPVRGFSQPLWQGESLAGRTLLIHAEQGYGDTLQMARYVRLAQELGGKVLLEVQPKLVPLLACSGFTDVLASGCALPPFDVQVPVLNLPGVFGSTSETIPREVPYVRADAALVASWRDKLARFEGLKVGIAWQGNRDYSMDRMRSIALAQFAPLASVPGVRLFSLQKNAGVEQLAGLAGQFQVEDLGPELDLKTGAFMDTAAVIANLDLVITSDTAIAHLAGAMGARTWLALAKMPDWRWFLERENCPWYPTMRLFRQRTAGDWPEVFARMAAELSGMAEGSALAPRVSVPDRTTSAERVQAAVGYQQAGELARAAAIYRQVLADEPNNADAHHLLGMIVLAQDRPDLAVEYFRTAIACDPPAAEFHFHLGTALARLGRKSEALESYAQAVRLQPDSAQMHNGLGTAQREAGHPIEAQAAYRQAVRLDPTFAAAHNNLGNVLQELGESEGALTSYQKCLQLMPEFPEAHLNLAMLYLSQERFAEGWPEFFWRLKCKKISVRGFRQPLWQGEPLAGRTLLVHAEQGYGDTLQMARYVRLAQERGGTVLLEVLPELAPLLACSGFTGVLPSGCELPPFDVQVPILNLPGVFGSTSETIPREIPYVQADPGLVASWRDRLARYQGLKVGIAWQGNRAYLMDHKRSIALAQFGPLASVPGVRLFSLQKNEGVEQLAALAGRFRVEDLGSELDEKTGAFMDTAAVIANLDLVITSDTAIAHLAGAMGAPTWLALARIPEWRWFLKREDSPWYPTMRLFRQRTAGDWPEVFARMAADLSEMAQGSAPSRRASEPPSRRDSVPDRTTSAERLHSAVGYHQAGDLARAAQIYRQVLAGEPNNADAHHLLGLVVLAQDRPDWAVEYFRTAIGCNPAAAQFHFHLGTALARLGRKSEAIDSYAQAVRLQPDSAAMHNALGTAHREAGHPIEAEAAYRQVVRLDPAFAAGHNNLGNALQDQGRLDEAVAAFRAALQLCPGTAEIHFNLGNCFKALNQTGSAIAEYGRAVALESDLALAHQNLGLVQQLEKRYEEAAACHRAAIAIAPDMFDAHNALGAALQMLGNFDEAKACYRRVLELDAGNVTAQYNLASAFHTEGNLDEAESRYRAVLERSPDHCESLSGMGMVCLMRGDLATARSHLERTLGRWPDAAEARFFQGTLLLAEGKLREGWPQFEYRAACRFGTSRSFPVPRWDGLPLAGRTLLVHAEYGFGDMMQFIRYYPLVHERANSAQVSFEVQEGLIPLLENSGFRGLVPRGRPLPHFDVEAPIMSLPGIFETSLETIPAQIPYLFADAARTERWKERLSKVEGFKVGIHWQGNAKYANDRNRSMPLACFEPLARVRGVTLISLQKQAGSEQVAKVADRFSVLALDGLDEQGGAFMDTAAVIENLDLVITSDSAVAHLAGAMGAPVWLLLALSAEWRWLLDREDSPWYPTMRLFRQRKLGDWAEVFERVAAALARRVENGRP